MWSNVISIDKSYDREIEYILGRLQGAKDLSYAAEESEGRLWIYLAGLCEKQEEIEEEIGDMLEVVFLSFLKLRFFLDRLHIKRMSHAKCALVCSIVHFDRDFEAGIVSKTLKDALDYSIDGLMNFRLRALSDGWQELADLANRLLDGCNDEADIYEIATFITGSEGKLNQLVLNKDRLRNLTCHKSVEIVRLFDDEEYNMLSAIIREKPSEILIESCDFTAPMNATLKKIVRVIEK
ncbi:MAG: hypothetical protein NC037_06365 [Bacteroides sp.]|nr:hypothetical protein [Bacillota bacterium]MCM1393612.1 hypothetical protein [[Eubacterium] siraeum]MCM1456128.1 hypothetical protein [Bacteroides sp.]